MTCKLFDIRWNNKLDFSFCMFLIEEVFDVICEVCLSTSLRGNGSKEANIVDFGPR
jgi:hypothetical protein